MFGLCLKILISHPIRRVALALLCLPYVVSGIRKLAYFDAGIIEMNSYGLVPAAPYAAATILIQLGCSVLILTGFLRWIGALLLAVFTMTATLIANQFWHRTGADYFSVLQTFCEQTALVGGLLLVAWYTLHKYKNKGRDDWL